VASPSAARAKSGILDNTCSRVIYAIPLAQKTFMLDTSNVAMTSIALGIGMAGAAVIEIIWWVEGALLGERRRL